MKEFRGGRIFSGVSQWKMLRAFEGLPTTCSHAPHKRTSELCKHKGISRRRLSVGHWGLWDPRFCWSARTGRAMSFVLYYDYGSMIRDAGTLREKQFSERDGSFTVDIFLLDTSADCVASPKETKDKRLRKHCLAEGEWPWASKLQENKHWYGRE